MEVPLMTRCLLSIMIHGFVIKKRPYRWFFMVLLLRRDHMSMDRTWDIMLSPPSLSSDKSIRGLEVHSCWDLFCSFVRLMVDPCMWMTMMRVIIIVGIRLISVVW